MGLKHVGIHREAHDHHDQDGKDARDQALDEGLGVEDALDVALGRADGAQDADLLLALQDTDVGDDADHDGAHHQRDAHEGNEHQADHVHDVRDGAHDDAHVVRVANHAVVLAGGTGPLVVGVNGGEHVLLGREVLGVDGDGDGVVRVRVAQGREVVVVGEPARVCVVGHERGQVLGTHVEADGALEGARINREGALQVGQARAHLIGNLGHDLPHGRLELSGDGGAHLLGKLGEEVLQVGGQLVLHVVGGNLLHALGKLWAGDGRDLGQDLLGPVGLQVLHELLADDGVEVGVVRVGGGAVLAPPGHKALGELACQAHDLPDLVRSEGGVDVSVRIAKDGREVRRGRTGDQGAHVKRGRDCRGVNARARHVDAREVDAAELGRVEGEGAPELCLVDREEAAQVNALLGLVLELVEGLAGEDVRVGVRELLPDDVGAGRAGHELLGEAMGVGDARAEGVGVGGLVGPHDAHDLEVKTVCHLLGHELRVVGHVGPTAGLGVGAVGLTGAQHLEGLVEGVLVGEGHVVLGHVHVAGGSHGGLHHAGQLAGVKHADAVERVVAHAAVAVEDQDGLVGGRGPTARHHVVLLGEKVLVVDHLVEDGRGAGHGAGHCRLAGSAAHGRGEGAGAELDRVAHGVGRVNEGRHAVVILDGVDLVADARVARVEVGLEALEVVGLHGGEHVLEHGELRDGIGLRDGLRGGAGAIGGRVGRAGVGGGALPQHAAHVVALLGDGERIAGERVLLHLGDVLVHAVGEGQDGGDPDDADGAREGRHGRAALLGHEVPEGEAQRGEEGHGRAARRLGLPARRGRRVEGVGVIGYAAVREAHDARGVALGKLGVVGDHNDQAVLGNLLEQVHDLHGSGRVEGAGGLVGKKNLRVVD